MKPNMKQEEIANKIKKYAKGAFIKYNEELNYLEALGVGHNHEYDDYVIASKNETHYGDLLGLHIYNTKWGNTKYVDLKVTLEPRYVRNINNDIIQEFNTPEEMLEWCEENLVPFKIK